MSSEPESKLKVNISPSAKALDGQGLKHLVLAGLTWLRTNHQLVNSLNVFPVPDGDTGTNMLLTMQAAYQEVVEKTNDEMNIGKVAHAIAQGALMGARGNSGVILSQLWRGFARGLDSLDEMDAQTLVKALHEARNTAYKGVVRPVEGTILTVAKDSSAAGSLAFNRGASLIEIFEAVVDEANASVERTPELLPILKQAGVVDSGGKGLFFLLDGMLRAMREQSLDIPAFSVKSLKNMKNEDTMESIEPGQDFEIVVDFRPSTPLDIDSFYTDLSEMGTSIQLGEGDGMFRVHIHVPKENAEKPREYIESIGTWMKISMENLMDQMNVSASSKPAIEFAPIKPGQIAIIAVAPGEGIARIFASLGVHGIVLGGQTMNPSTEEILKSFENLPTDRVIILPNNKNIVLAAETAKTLSVKHVDVIPTVNVPQGLHALLSFNCDGNLDDVVSTMKHSIEGVDAGEITTATRSVEINGVHVKEGQVIALHNGKLVAASSSTEKATMQLLDKAGVKDKELITLFYGSNIDQPEIDYIVSRIQKKYPDQTVEVHQGGQPFYQFIISLE
jgi:DAK2 domain fusion protein YloV